MNAVFASLTKSGEVNKRALSLAKSAVAVKRGSEVSIRRNRSLNSLESNASFDHRYTHTHTHTNTHTHIRKRHTHHTRMRSHTRKEHTHTQCIVKRGSVVSIRQNRSLNSLESNASFDHRYTHTHTHTQTHTHTHTHTH